MLHTCLTPLVIPNPKFPLDPNAMSHIEVPCGKCPECRKRRAAHWSFRLMQEDKVSKSSYFITLTYETHAVPITPHGFLTLRPSDLSDYWKRLRKRMYDSGCKDKLRYYAVGEYGTKRQRPHYHAIVFNCPSVDMIVDAWSLDGKAIGVVHVGQVSDASIMYTVNYMSKPYIVPAHGRDDRVKEFSRMSKGLGLSYLTPAMIRWIKDDLDRQYVVMPDGWKASMPRYYKDRVFDADEMKVVKFWNRIREDGDVEERSVEAVKQALDMFNDKVRIAEKRNKI